MYSIGMQKVRKFLNCSHKCRTLRSWVEQWFEKSRHIIETFQRLAQYEFKIACLDLTCPRARSLPSRCGGTASGHPGRGPAPPGPPATRWTTASSLPNMPTLPTTHELKDAWIKTSAVPGGAREYGAQRHPAKNKALLRVTLINH